MKAILNIESSHKSIFKIYNFATSSVSLLFCYDAKRQLQQEQQQTNNGPTLDAEDQWLFCAPRRSRRTARMRAHA